MNDSQMTRRTMGMLVLGSLAACGGGGSSESELVTGEYRLESVTPWTKERVVEVCNELGAQGYAYVSSLFGESSGSVREILGEIFLKDSGHVGAKLEYTTASHPESSIAGLEMFNERGKQGFLVKSVKMSFDDKSSLMVRDANRAATYAYALEPHVSESLEALMDMLSRLGRAGFRFHGTLKLGGLFYLFAKDESISKTYEYSSEGAGYGGMGLKKVELLQQLNAKGAAGWLWRHHLHDDQRAKSRQTGIYERTSTQRGAVEYEIDFIDRSMNAAQRMEILNAKVNQGFFWFGHVYTSDEGVQNMWVRNGGMLADGNDCVAYPW